MLVLSATKNLIIKVIPYKDFNSSVNATALVIINGKLISGRVIYKNRENGKISLIRDTTKFSELSFSDFIVNESDIIGFVMKDLSDYDSLEIMEI